MHDFFLLAPLCVTFNHPFMKLSIKSNHLLLFVLNNNISMEKTTYALFHYGFSFFSSESSSRTGVVRQRAYFEVVLLICCYCWLQSYFDDRLVSTHTNKKIVNYHLISIEIKHFVINSFHHQIDIVNELIDLLGILRRSVDSMFN